MVLHTIISHHDVFNSTDSANSATDNTYNAKNKSSHVVPIVTDLSKYIKKRKKNGKDW